MSNKYLRLNEAPQLVVSYPDCSACAVEVEWEDGFICPSCGTLWDPSASDGDDGILYESWAGEPAEGPEATVDEAWLAPKVEHR